MKIRRRVNIICKICNKEFQIFKSLEKIRKTCSKQCYGKYISNLNTGINNGNWGGGKIKKNCKLCYKSFEIPFAWLKKGDGKFCSKACLAKFRNQFPRKYHGYIWIHNPSHPSCNHVGRIQEHRVIVEKYIDRILEPQEEVHHVNKNRSDNRINNLMAFVSSSAHLRFERGGKIKPEEIIFDGRNH